MGWRLKKRANSLAGMSPGSGTLRHRECASVPSIRTIHSSGVVNPARKKDRNFSVFRRKKADNESSVPDTILEIRDHSLWNSPGSTLIDIERTPKTNVEYRPLVNSLQPPPRRFKLRETSTPTPSRSIRNDEEHGGLKIRVKHLERELLKMKDKLDSKKVSKHRIITKEDLWKRCARIGQSAHLLNDLRVNAAALTIQRIYRGYATRGLIKRHLEINAAALTIQKHWRQYSLNRRPQNKVPVPQADFATLIRLECEERDAQLRFLREEIEKLKDEIRFNFGQSVNLMNKNFDRLSPRTDPPWVNTVPVIAMAQ